MLPITINTAICHCFSLRPANFVSEFKRTFRSTPEGAEVKDLAMYLA